MLKIVFLILALFYVSLFAYSLYQIWVKDRYVFLLVFLILYLPLYISFQSIFFAAVPSPGALLGWQVLKELIILIAVLSYVLKVRRPLHHRVRITTPDFLYLAFILLAFIFVLLPIGTATISAKALYFKNMLLPTLMFFLGRNMRLRGNDQQLVVGSIFTMIFLAFVINAVEVSSGVHFQKLIQYERYNFEVLENEPEGYYRLGWNFEKGPNSPRFAAFYANSLEAGAVSIMFFCFAFYWFWHTRWRDNQLVFGALALMAWFTNYVAFGRSSLVGLVMALLFIAFLLRYYSLLLGTFGGVALLLLLVVNFGSDDIRYFIIDTITFRQASSFGHLVGWIEGVESMIVNPQGIGIAMSGSSALVEDELRTGGENQFIIYGVQLGVVGLLLYLSLLVSSILYCMRSFHQLESLGDRLWPFVGGATKFGILLPLFTSNAEFFPLLSSLSWWVVGYSIQLYKPTRL
ncbi:MAG: hypothetical protein AAGA85_04500 [Bacteroidota bacterium]